MLQFFAESIEQPFSLCATQVFHLDCLLMVLIYFLLHKMFRGHLIAIIKIVTFAIGCDRSYCKKPQNDSSLQNIIFNQELRATNDSYRPKRVTENAFGHRIDSPPISRPKRSRNYICTELETNPEHDWYKNKMVLAIGKPCTSLSGLPAWNFAYKF